MAALDGSLVDYNANKLILFATELFKFLVLNWLRVLDFLVIFGLEPVEMDNEVLG